MERARELSEQDQHPAHLRQQSATYAAVWLAALRRYAIDVREYDRRNRCGDEGEAYADLLTTCELLANLCEPLELDLETAKRMVFEFVG